MGSHVCAHPHALPTLSPTPWKPFTSGSPCPSASECTALSVLQLQDRTLTPPSPPARPTASSHSALSAGSSRRPPHCTSFPLVPTVVSLAAVPQPVKVLQSHKNLICRPHLPSAISLPSLSATTWASHLSLLPPGLCTCPSLCWEALLSVTWLLPASFRGFRHIPQDWLSVTS